MNATEDDQPLGESPELAAIQRGGVTGLLSAKDQMVATVDLVRRQSTAITEIRARHTRNQGWCAAGCHGPYPCPTVRALDEQGC